MGIDHPHFGTFCAICFGQLTPETCAVDESDQKWDICPGQCAREAGIREARDDGQAVEQDHRREYGHGA